MKKLVMMFVWTISATVHEGLVCAVISYVVLLSSINSDGNGAVVAAVDFREDEGFPHLVCEAV